MDEQRWFITKLDAHNWAIAVEVWPNPHEIVVDSIPTLPEAVSALAMFQRMGS